MANPTNSELIETLSELFGAEMPHFYQLILCESSGKVSARHLNDNGTTDYSLLQINSTHFKEAEKLGLDFVNNWQDNLKMGQIIFERQGYSAWLICSAKIGI